MMDGSYLICFLGTYLRMDKFIPNLFNFWVVIFVALGSMSCSYGMSVISSTIGQPTFYTYFNLATQGEPGYSRTTALIGAINGLSSVGSVFGAGFTSWAADWAGRKRNIQMGALVIILGGGLCAGSVNMTMFLIARFIAGLGIGMLVTGIPMYVSCFHCILDSSVKADLQNLGIRQKSRRRKAVDL
jgi:MFS family permease